jgi:hypothetical protein
LLGQLDDAASEQRVVEVVNARVLPPPGRQAGLGSPPARALARARLAGFDRPKAFSLALLILCHRVVVLSQTDVRPNYWEVSGPGGWLLCVGS